MHHITFRYSISSSCTWWQFSLYTPFNPECCSSKSASIKCAFKIAWTHFPSVCFEVHMQHCTSGLQAVLYIWCCEIDHIELYTYVLFGSWMDWHRWATLQCYTHIHRGFPCFNALPACARTSYYCHDPHQRILCFSTLPTYASSNSSSNSGVYWVMVPKYWSESINPANQMMVWLLSMLLSMLLLPICNLLQETSAALATTGTSGIEMACCKVSLGVNFKSIWNNCSSCLNMLYYMVAMMY